MIHVERLRQYSPEVAADLGRLMPFLSESLTDAPIPEDRLKAIVDSPFHDQLIARNDKLVVGAATLSIVMAAGAGPRGYLEDFVTHPESKGAGSALWDETGRWCLERHVKLNFTSNSNRLTAHHFYSKRATIRNTTVFRADFEQ